MNNLNEILAKMAEFLKSESKTETIMGEQFKLGEFTCVPVMTIGMGLAAGGADGKGNVLKANEAEGSGSGGGAGINLGPVGFLVTKGSEIQFISTVTSKGIGAAFEKVPDLIEKFLNVNKKEKETAKV